MHTYAYVAGAKVVEIIVAESLDGLYHPDFVALCHPCDAEVAPGWSFDEGAFAPPVVVNPVELQAAAD